MTLKESILRYLDLYALRSVSIDEIASHFSSEDYIKVKAEVLTLLVEEYIIIDSRKRFSLDHSKVRRWGRWTD